MLIIVFDGANLDALCTFGKYVLFCYVLTKK